MKENVNLVKNQNFKFKNNDKDLCFNNKEKEVPISN
jgi:hypothetical protein